MSYKINKTDGTLLVELTDGTINTTSSDITLVGRNYKGFGELINENFVRMLENFSSTSAPSNPLKGQLWWDSSVDRLKIYNGDEFRTAGSPIVSSTQPNNLVAGDIWIDNDKNRLYFYDGTDIVLVGPQYDDNQGETGVKAISVVDTISVTRVVLGQYIAGVLAGIWSTVEFTPSSSSTISGYAAGRVIKVGFNPATVSTYKYRGTAESAEALVNSAGTSFTTADFIRTNERDSSNNLVDQELLAGLFVKGLTGLRIGYQDSHYGTFKVESTSTDTVIQVERTSSDFAIKIKDGSENIDAIKVAHTDKKVGIFNSNPTKELDVTGDAKISGDLTVDGDITVNGDTTYFNTQTLRVEDKNIELGLLNDSTEGDDSAVDGGGITLRSSNGSKDIYWVQSTGNWTLNQNVDLISGKEYRIGNTQVLSRTKLGDTVTTANGLTSLGTLSSLTVSGNITVGGNIVNAGPLTIDAGGDISVDSQKIVDVADPTADNDAANKGYVDAEIAKGQDIGFALDITGFTSPAAPTPGGNGPYTDVLNVLNSVYPVDATKNDVVARIHAYTIGGSTVSNINVTVATDTSGTLQKSLISVDKNGTENQSVIEDIAVANATSGTLNVSPTRYTMVFTVVGGVWTWTSTSDYS